MTEVDNAGTPGMPNVVLTSQYDANGNRTELAATVDGTADFVNAYSYDPLNRMTRIEQTDGAPSAGDPISEKRVDLSYNAAGQFETIARYADLAGTDLVATSSYSYDGIGRLTALSHDKGANTLADYAWTFDAGSRITSFTGPDGTSTYSYDATSQLTAADHSYQTDEAYDYDENGNRTSTGYQTGTNNRLLSDGTYSYEYDDEGNRTKRTEIATGDYVEYQWDHRNRLVAVAFRTSAGTLTKKVELDYDVYSRLIAKRVDDDGNGTFERAQKFVYDGTQIVLVYDDSGSLENRLLYGPAVDQFFADENALGEVLWGLTDHLGTVRDLVEYDSVTDTTSVVNHIEYDSFGNITAQTSASDQPLLAFTGRYWDEDIDLQWNWNRWYDPTVGRWLSEDPIGFAAGDPNLYRYVGNNAVNFTDPTGRDSFYPGWNPYVPGSGLPGWIPPDPSEPMPGNWPARVYLEDLFPGITGEQRATVRYGCVGLLRVRLGLPRERERDPDDPPPFRRQWYPFTELPTRGFANFRQARALYARLRQRGRDPFLYAVQVPTRLPPAAPLPGGAPGEVDLDTLVVAPPFNFASMLPTPDGGYLWEWMPFGGYGPNLPGMRVPEWQDLIVRRRRSLPGGFTNYYCVTEQRDGGYEPEW